MAGSGQRLVEHLERRLRLLYRLLARFGVALRLREEERMEEGGEERLLQFGDRPEAPLQRLRLALERPRPETLVMLLGEVAVDRHRFPQLHAVVVDRRNLAIGIDREIVRGLGAAVGEMDRHVLVVEAELLRAP